MTTTEDHVAAVALADLAGERLLQVRHEVQRQGITGREAKDIGDAASQEVLAAALAERFPQDAVLSEEATDDRGRLEAERVWIIDPLDGTREFSEFERDDWAVHVALWQHGELTAGAVALPARGVTYGSADAYAPEPSTNGLGLRLAVSRSRPPEFVTALAQRLSATLVPMGSAGVKAMSVVAGLSDAYIHGGGQYEWDSAAPVAVARAAGLYTSRLDGSPLLYNNENPWLPDLIVCHERHAEKLLREISDIST
ncbi:MAG: 3'(2'),5'-bisphosphate nucleotidase CysQ [Ornithinimicrobium sp.]